jgi:hypothetical protein
MNIEETKQFYIRRLERKKRRLLKEKQLKSDFCYVLQAEIDLLEEFIEDLNNIKPYPGE